MTEIQNRQLMHPVLGGKFKPVGSVDFRDPAALHVAGIFPNSKAAYGAWKAAAQSAVDNAPMCNFIVHMNRLPGPATYTPQATGAK